MMLSVARIISVSRAALLPRYTANASSSCTSSTTAPNTRMKTSTPYDATPSADSGSMPPSSSSTWSHCAASAMSQTTPAITRSTTSTAPAPVETGRFMSGGGSTGRTSSAGGSNAARFSTFTSHRPSSTASAGAGTSDTSITGRSPSVRIVSPPPLRE